MNTIQNISILGLGYIGLPTATMFANYGIYTKGVDLNETIIEKVNNGVPHFGEPNLDVLLRLAVDRGFLTASRDVTPSDAFIITVPTPMTDDKLADLSFVYSATCSISPHLKKGDLIILESTVPTGTTEKLSKMLEKKRPDLTFPHIHGEEADINIAFCPERVLPGKIVDEVQHNHRIIGGLSRKCAQRAMNLYKIFVKGECHLTDAKTAEMAKLTENAFRDVNIAFANELSMIAEEHGINVWELIRLANLHPRVNILNPGPGVGGHCIAVDPWFIVEKSDHAKIIKTAREVNDSKPHFIVHQVEKAIETTTNPVVACLGLSYKADVGDLRESPSLEIVASLAKNKQAKILVVEPHIEKLPTDLVNHSVELTSFENALEQANIVVLLVDHKAFLQITHYHLRHKVVIDTRGRWS
jgi:UDP-N-acetyl-D-mannosaminuronic acid dehydrogenase